MTQYYYQERTGTTQRAWMPSDSERGTNTMQMNEALEAWIKDLRSGEYSQTRGRLVRYGTKNGQGHCCLGVACRNAIKPEGGWTSRNSLTMDERDRLGIDGDDSRDLIQLNDTHGFTFNEIADVIEDAANRGVNVSTVCHGLRMLDEAAA